ncbi:GAF and ANTAR domain-containing protein [Nocardioides zeicaulis]|uniref:GAF and ANTAR domain-containing protein n=1 Tax=Nocardioides zeicaulis TaxID=1776857 RepID=A0ABV6E4V3_9ACTN
METDDRAHLLTRLALELQSARDTEPTADAVIQQTLDLVPDADWVSLTLRSARRRFVTLAATAEVASTADELQYTLREGPCVDAALDGDWYRSGSVGDDPRWPTWGPRAAEVGVASLLSVKLATEDSVLGALNMYSGTPGAFTDRDSVDFAVLYGAHAAVALTAAREISGLHSAIHSRHTIGLAQGILMERYGLGVDASFSLLRRCSTDLHLKVADVAADIVTTRRLPVATTASPQSEPTDPASTR